MFHTMIRRSRVTGKKHQLNRQKSKKAKLSHHKFLHKKRPASVKRKISKGVHKALRTHRTVFGLKVRRAAGNHRR